MVSPAAMLKNVVEQEGCPGMKPLGTLTLVNDGSKTQFDVIEGEFNLSRITVPQSDLIGYKEPFRISISIDTNTLPILVDKEEGKVLKSPIVLYLWRYFDGYVNATDCLRRFDNGTGESSFVFLSQGDEIERIVFHKIEEVEGSVYVEMEVTSPDHFTMDSASDLKMYIATYLKIVWLRY